jgi:hypothetical protein
MGQTTVEKKIYSEIKLSKNVVACASRTLWCSAMCHSHYNARGKECNLLIFLCLCCIKERLHKKSICLCSCVQGRPEGGGQFAPGPQLKELFYISNGIREIF